MAKIDKRDTKLKKPNKRKLKEILEADSPTSKFKKLGKFLQLLIYMLECYICAIVHLDISMLKTKSKKKLVQKTEIRSTALNCK